MNTLKTLTLLSLFLCMSNSRAQVSFNTLDEHPGLVPINTYTDSQGNLLTIHNQTLIGYMNQRLLVKQWNGLFWVHYPAFESNNFQISLKNRTAVCKFQNKIVAAASFIKKDSSFSGVCQWTGSKWEVLGDGLFSDYKIRSEISISDMQTFDGKLFVCGMFNRAGTKKVQNFVFLDNNQWTGIANTGGRFNDIQIDGDTLYVAGSFTEIEGSSALNLAAYYQNAWHGLYAPVNAEILGLSVFQKNLILYTKAGIYQYSNNNWTKLSDSKTLFFGNTAVYENNLYAAGTFQESSGELIHLKMWNGSNFNNLIREADIAPKNSLPFFVNADSKGLLFSGYLNALFGKQTQHCVYLYPGKITLQGQVYKDNNQNCIFDAGDEAKANAIVSLNEGASYTSTDINGVYKFVLPPLQTSSIRVFPASDETSVCQNDVINIPTGGKDSAITLNFALQEKALPPAPRLNLIANGGFQARHGYTSNYTINYNNQSKPFPVQIRVDYTKGLNDFKSNLEPIELGSDYVVWEIQENSSISFSFKVDHKEFKTGDFLAFNSDAMYENQSIANAALDQEIVSAYDPNAKDCSKTSIAKNARNLDYYIQFQNLGNDSAVQVHVVDTISRTLPMQFIQMQGYSHPQQADVSFKVRDHAIVWTFNNIYLAPKAIAGDAKSSGFIQFQAGLLSNLKFGDSIENQAQIYFDYQAPVFTNKIVTRVNQIAIDPPLVYSPFQIYPNPGRGPFKVSYAPYLIQEIEVFTLSGQRLYHTAVAPYASTAEVDPGNLIPGIYIVKLTHTQGVVSAKLIVGE